MFLHQLQYPVIGDHPCAEGVHPDGDRLGHADGIGQLNLALAGQPGGYDVLGHPAGGVGGGAVHLGGVLAGEAAAAVGGAIVDSGRFDWEAHADKYPGLTTPDESYHGVTYTKKFGQGGAYITKATAQLMRDFGSTPAPMNAWLLGMGIETLPLRMARHCSNAQGVAEYLRGHEKVAWVRYAGLPGDKYHALAQKYLPKGCCGVVSFGVKGGRAAAERFMAGLKLASIATHVADAKTCVLHPASATHRQMNDAELAAAGVAPDLVRFSVGLEDLDDLIQDLAQALEEA